MGERLRAGRYLQRRRRGRRGSEPEWLAGVARLIAGVRPRLRSGGGRTGLLSPTGGWVGGRVCTGSDPVQGEGRRQRQGGACYSRVLPCSCHGTETDGLPPCNGSRHETSIAANTIYRAGLSRERDAMMPAHAIASSTQNSKLRSFLK